MYCGKSNHHRLAFQEAAALALIKAVDFRQQSELTLACQIMKACNPASSMLRYAFLTNICQSGRFADAAMALRYLSQRADQHMYHTLMQRLAYAEPKGVPLSVHPL